MRKNIIIGLAAAVLGLAGVSCSHDYDDSTKVHVYGPDENPPVKADPSVTGTRAFEMQSGDTDPVTIDIYDYADMIETAFGVTPDELLSKLGTEYVVCPINPNRMVWNKAAANTGDEYGWYINKNANVCEQADPLYYGKLVFNAPQHRFEFYLDPEAGGSVPMEIGFAKVGPNYNTHVRFVMAVTAYDRSYVFRDIVIPAGDYNAYEWDWSDFEENIKYVFGDNWTWQKYHAATEQGEIGIFMIDHATNAFMWDGESTANGGGYWCDSAGNIVTWGSDGCTYYIEPWMDPDWDEHCYAIGRFPGIAPGTVCTVKFGAALNADHSKALTFILTATFE